MSGSTPMSPPGKLIDVLITTYNAAATLPAALASIQRQTVRDIGIVVVDDGSTDGSGEFLAEAASRDPRVRVITIPNGGIVDAANIGLSHTDAAYVARFDADDVAFEDRLARQLDFLRANPRHVAVGANVWHIDGEGNRTGTRSHFRGDVAPNAHWVPSREPYLLHSFVMVRRDALLQVGGYRSVFYAEDTDLYWRLLGLGGLHSLSDILGEVRVHANSVTSASIVNGRVSAMNSQLSAISARRREAGVEDLTFHPSLFQAAMERRRIRPMLDLWAPRLTTEEQRYLDVAVAAKLLELATHRPYELEVEDCRFIRRALIRDRRLVSAGNAMRIGKTLARTLARLARTGHLREAAALVGLSR